MNKLKKYIKLFAYSYNKQNTYEDVGMKIIER